MKRQLALTLLLIPMLAACQKSEFVDQNASISNQDQMPVTANVTPALEQPANDVKSNIAIVHDTDSTNSRKRALNDLKRPLIKKVNSLVLHHTAMSDDEDAVRVLRKSLFTTYLILKTGKVLEILPADVVAESTLDASVVYDADANGNLLKSVQASQFAGNKPLDHQTVSVEINYAPQNGESPNPAQLKSLAELIAFHAKKDVIPPTGILFHSTVQPCFTNVFKDSVEGDGCKFNEPGNLAFNYNATQSDKTITKSDGMYALIAEVRKLGVWKDGPYKDMTDKQVADVIYNRNFYNAAQFIDSNGGAPQAQVYRSLATK
jgi:N-acetyl-anhydromuramyl-L-alanine amidase AmpD